VRFEAEFGFHYLVLDLSVQEEWMSLLAEVMIMKCYRWLCKEGSGGKAAKKE